MNTFTTSPYRSEPLEGGSGVVTLRALTPEDAGAVYALHTRLKPESLYSRYLQYRVPTADEISAICAMDPAQGAGVVAETQAGRKRIVGMAYYVRDGAYPPSSAEVAIVIEDRCQGFGIGRLLWQRLHQQAEADGLSELRVLFSAYNRRMLRLILSSGYRYECCYAATNGGDLNDYRVALGSRQAPSRVRRLLAKITPPLF